VAPATASFLLNLARLRIAYTEAIVNVAERCPDTNGNSSFSDDGVHEARWPSQLHP